MTRDVRLAWSVFLLAAAFALPVAAQAIAIAGAWLLTEFHPDFLPASPSRERVFHRYELSAVGFLLLSVLMNGIFEGGAERLAVGGVSLSIEGMHFGLRTSLRLILAGTALMSALLPLSRSAFAVKLRASPIPRSIVSASLIALTLLEELPIRFRSIQEAQTARGAVWHGSLIDRLRALRLAVAPILFRSLEEALQQGTALHLRGLHRPSHLPVDTPASTLEPRSFPAVVLLALAAGLTAYGIVQWLASSPFGA